MMYLKMVREEKSLFSIGSMPVFSREPSGEVWVRMSVAHPLLTCEPTLPNIKYAVQRLPY